MDKLSSYIDYQFCNRKVEKSRYLNHLRDTYEYADDRILKLIACPVFECETKCINNLLKTLKFIEENFMFSISIIDMIVKVKRIFIFKNTSLRPAFGRSRLVRRAYFFVREFNDKL
uniref:Reverse transcriptase domain-containing protein n=1 Tax=Strongyloides venezuelensis TaxID=75913 RepID=A0A0K0FS13_STRVS